jgi:hypothetical protein
MNGWRLEAHAISIKNNYDWSFTKPPQMKDMRLCTAQGAMDLRLQNNIRRQFEDSFSL